MFQALTFNGVDVSVYTCPAGKRAVLTNLQLTFGSVSPGTFFYMRDSVPGPILQALEPDPLMGLKTYQYFGRWVIDAGESFWITINSGTSDSGDVYGSGYELTLP